MHGLTMYVIVRNDLPKSYQAVQGGHSVAQFMLEHSDIAKAWDNQRLIYLNVDTQGDLDKMIYKMKKLDIKHSYFKEPDIGNEITAMSVVVSEDKRRYFKKLKLI